MSLPTSARGISVNCEQRALSPLSHYAGSVCVGTLSAMPRTSEVLTNVTLAIVVVWLEGDLIVTV